MALSLMRTRVRRDTKTTSPAVAAQAAATRRRAALVCKGISEGDLITVGIEQFKLLDVDTSYQRDRINHRVNDLIDAIRGGGLIPDPVTLVKRKFKQAGVDPEKLWIIDGQQRTYAFLELNRPFK